MPRARRPAAIALGMGAAGGARRPDRLGLALAPLVIRLLPDRPGGGADAHLSRGCLCPAADRTPTGCREHARRARRRDHWHLRIRPRRPPPRSGPRVVPGAV